MPSDKPIQSLKDILENIDWVIQYTRDHGFREFVQDRLVGDAVERCLMRISEAARRLEGLVDELIPNRARRRIRVIDSAICCDYDSVDPKIIWSIVESELLPLETAVEKAIEELERRK